MKSGYESRSICRGACGREGNGQGGAGWHFAAGRLRAAAAVCLGCLMMAGCAGDPRFDHPGPPHPGAANPWSMGGFSDPGPNYPATGH